MNLIFLTSLCISVSGVKCRENTQSSDEFSCPVLKRVFLLLLWTVTSGRRQPGDIATMNSDRERMLTVLPDCLNYFLKDKTAGEYGRQVGKNHLSKLNQEVGLKHCDGCSGLVISH